MAYTIVELTGDRLNLARELLQVARDEFARAEEAKGGAAVIGLHNACGKGWLAALEAVNSYCLCRACLKRNCPRTTRADISL